MSSSDVVVAGPWLGEVGFELLYWVPFLRWFARRFEVPPERLLVVSRGGTASWYRPFSTGYREIFDYVTPEEFRHLHDERVAANGEQKQTQVLTFEHQLLRQVTGDVEHRTMLHPSSMYRLFNPFWWGHVDESWVHERATYARLVADTVPGFQMPAAPYTAVKFYFNECFPATDANRAFVRAAFRRLAARGPVVSLATGLRLDDHDGGDAESLGVQSLPPNVPPRENLACRPPWSARRRRSSAPTAASRTWRRSLACAATAYYSNRAGFSRAPSDDGAFRAGHHWAAGPAGRAPRRRPLPRRLN